MAGIQYVVNAIDGASSTFGKIARSADALNAQLADLSRQNATPSVELQDKIFQTKVTSAKASIAELSKRIAHPAAELQDKMFKLGIADAQVKLDRLSAKVAKPEIELRGLHSAELGILKVGAMLDKLDGRKAEVTVDVNRRGGLLSRLGGLFGGGGSGGGGDLMSKLLGASGGKGGKGGSGFLGWLAGGGKGGSGGAAGGGAGLAGLAGLAGPAGIGAAALAAASLAPALLPTLLGVGVGAGAAGGAFAVGSKANKQMQTLAKQLATAKGPAKQDILSQMAALRKSSAPELAIFGAFQDLGHSALGTFTSALESKGGGTPSFLTGLTGILKQLGGFIKTIGPGLGAMFRASLPFLGAFVKALEQAAKILLPVFTQSLRQMQPFLPMISQGLLAIVQGLAGMIKAMGPGGMKAAAQIFVALCKAMEGILIAVGYTANFLAETFRDVGLKIRQRVSDWHRTFDDFRHRTAVVFDGVRHDIAHIWDMVWDNTIGRMIRGQQDMFKLGDEWRHHIANIFDGVRHDIAHVWDDTWHRVLSILDGAKHVIMIVLDNISSLVTSSWRQFWRSTVGSWVKEGFDKVTNVIDHARHFIAGVFDDIRGILDHFRHWVAGAFDDIRHTVSHTWDVLWDDTLGRFIKFNHDATARGNAFRHDTSGIFDDIRHDVAHTWDLLWDYSIGRLINAYSKLMGATAGFRHGITSTFDAIRHGIAHIWDMLWSGLAAATRGGIRVLGNVLNGLKNAFMTPVRWVVSNVLDPMVRVWDAIVGAVGQKNLQFTPPHLAEGGMIRGGQPGRDSVVGLLMPGEVVVPTAMVQAGAVDHLRGQLPGFQHGGRVGQHGPGANAGQPSGPGSNVGAFRTPWRGPGVSAASILRDITSWIGKGASWVTSHAFGGLESLLGHIPGASGVAHLEGGIAKTLIADAVKGIIKALTAFGGSGSGSAIAAYAMRWLGKIPYVWGGTAVPGGADCSGFTQAVYKHFGYNAPRTSEQQGAWVKRGPPQTGGLAFYHSPAGGPDPGHVAIVRNAAQVISQGGGMGPQLMALHGLPLLWTGTPPGGFAKAGTSARGRWTLPGLEGLWDRARGPVSKAHIAGAIALAESGGNPRARNPSGASGLWQILGQVVPGNIFDPFINAENAVKKYRDAGGFSPWVTYTSGAYRRFMANGGLITEPVMGVGRSGTRYMLGESGPEMVTPLRGGGAAAREGPLVYVENQYVRDPVDVPKIASQLSFKVITASMG